MPGAAAETDRLQRFCDTLAAFFPTGIKQGNLDILHRIRPRQQVESLENEADAGIADIGELVIGELRYLYAIQPVGPRCRPMSAIARVSGHLYTVRCPSTRRSRAIRGIPH